jgi:hypothetical protein
MVRVAAIVLVMLLALNTSVFGQGVIDSVLGSGGLGFWGNSQYQQSVSQQFNSPQFYGAPQSYGQQGFQQPPGGQTQPQQMYQPPVQGGYSPGYGQPYQNTYRDQSGVYSDWHTYPPAGTQNYPPPAQPQVTRQPAPQVQAGQDARRQPLRPGQYSPSQQPPGYDVDQLPDGAVQVITTTPDGTTVQYYGPRVQQAQPRPAVAGPKRPKPRQASARTGEKTSKPAKGEGKAQDQVTTVAMPKPVKLPTNRDPRTGWEAAVNRNLASPSSH